MCYLYKKSYGQLFLYGYFNRSVGKLDIHNECLFKKLIAFGDHLSLCPIMVGSRSLYRGLGRASYCQHKGCQRPRLSASAWDSRGDNQRGLAAMTLINGPEVSYPPAEVTAPTFLPVINCRWFHNVCCSSVISRTKRPCFFATERIHVNKLQLVDYSALHL